MRKLVSIVFALSIVALSAARADDDGPITVDDPSNSLVFGYIDMTDAPTKVSGAWLEQLSPPTDSPYWSMGVEDGLFYNTFIQPGSYKLSSFSGSGFMAGAHEYHFPRQGHEDRDRRRLRAREGGLHRPVRRRSPSSQGAADSRS